MRRGKSVRVCHEQGLTLPVKPERFIFSGFVDSVVDLVDGADVVAVGEEGELRCLEAFLSHLEPGLTEGVDLAFVNVSIRDIERYEVDSGIA